MASFKQQCPACEAMVPIRDEGLIGRKIDCPKCKKRFEVEGPPEESEPEAPAKPSKKTSPDKGGGKDKPAPKGKDKAPDKPAAKTKPGPRKSDDEDGDEEAGKPSKKKKAAGSSNMLLVGGGLGGLALIVLIAAVWFIFGGSGGSSPPPRRSPGPPIASNTNPGQVPGQPPSQPPVQTPDGGDTKPPTAPTGILYDNITNLLPNDTQAVAWVHVERLLGCSLRQAMLNTPGSFNSKAFEETFSFPFDTVSRILISVNTSQKWVFAVLRTTKPFDPDKVVAQLKLNPEAPINSLKYYLVKKDLDALSNLFLKANNRRDPFALHIIDPQTLVFADLAPMKEFLVSDRTPKRYSQANIPETTTPPATTPSTGMPPTGTAPTGTPPTGTPPTGTTPTGTSPTGTPPTGTAPTGTPPTGVAPTGGPATGQPPMGTLPTSTAAGSGSWLTLKDPDLKGVLDRIDRSDDPLIVGMVGDIRYWVGVTPLLRDLGPLLRGLVPPEQVGMVDTGLRLGEEERGTIEQSFKLVALGLKIFKEDRLAGLVALEAIDEKAAKAWSGTFLSQTGAKPGNPPTMPPTGISPNDPTAVGFPPTGLAPTGPPTTKPKAKDERFSAALLEKMFLFTVNKPLGNKLYTESMNSVENYMVFLRGEAEMVNAHSKIHELAAATQAYLKANKHFPRGTVSPTEDSNHVSTLPPLKRLSWMVELLPYLSGGDFKDLTPKLDKPWSEGENQILAQLVIPQFLARGSKNGLPYRVRYPGTDRTYAATHFVGIAGVGLDAPYYQAKDAATAKKLGIFGYDRETTLADIADGPANTILLLQVPVDHKAPWLAGGGSTVRGVSEDGECLRQFVCARHDGKDGTFAIMADGKVRFIPETIPLETFRALCTIAGGEKIDNLNTLAPEVPPDTMVELKTPTPPAGENTKPENPSKKEDPKPPVKVDPAPTVPPNPKDTAAPKGK